MSEVFGYDGASLGQAVIRLGEIPGFVQMADQGGVGMSNVILDDPGSALAIVGWHSFTVDELSETAGDRRLLTAYVGARTYRRGTDPRISLRTGSDNEIEMDLSDENEALGFHIITGTDSNRPSETVDARVAWLLGSTYLSGLVYDNGYVASNTTVMDAVDYQGQKPTDVLADCALAAHFNFFAQYLESAAQITLFFFDPNTSNLWDSGVYISNDLADIDAAAIANGTATVFYALDGAELRRDPANVYSGVFLPYKNPPPIYVTDGTIAAAFIARDGSAPNSNVVTSAAATVVANNFLADNATEDDTITLTTQVRDIQANVIKAGQLVMVKQTQMPGYSIFTRMRAKQRSIAQSIETDQFYQVNLILTPAPQPDYVASWAIMDHHQSDTDDYPGPGKRGYPDAWRVPWTNNGNFPPGGWGSPKTIALYGLLEYQSWNGKYPAGSPGSPMGGPYTAGGPLNTNMGSGIKCLGSGTVDLYYQGNAQETLAPGVLVEIRKNGGTVLASTLAACGGSCLNTNWYLSALGVTVVTNDILECWVYSAGGAFSLGAAIESYFYVSGYLA